MRGELPELAACRLAPFPAASGWSAMGPIAMVGQGHDRL